MKKKYIIFGLFLSSSLYGLGQRADSSFNKKRVSRTAIQVVYSHYLQDGSHSAVTGGIGTEKLTVYSPGVKLTHQSDSLHSYSINAGVDVITSASTDNIDFVVSSASRNDARMYADVGYNLGIKKTGLTISGTGHFSIESDYLSTGFGLAVNHTNKSKTRQLSAEAEVYLDDLRWGRLSKDEPLKLLYPKELRGRTWFREYHRRSYNFNTMWQQVINRRMIVALFPGVVYQDGLLSTPFHRVFFRDSSLKVENLPQHRLKIPIGIQLNSFIGARYILRTYYRYYWDDFGIRAHTFEVSLPVKITPALVLSPFGRYYQQTAADYFRPYREHELTAKFYTSDYDLSKFHSLEGGLETRLHPKGKKPVPLFNELTLRYGYYKRSDGLYAHSISLLIDMLMVKTK
ncbi:MAG: DUF3570 domain-containing protein [Chitinophagaceae bacterium]